MIDKNTVRCNLSKNKKSIYFEANSNRSANISLKLTSAWISGWLFWLEDRFSLGLGMFAKVAAKGWVLKYSCWRAFLAVSRLALSYLTNSLNKSTASLGASGTIFSKLMGLVSGNVILEKSGNSWTPGQTFSVGEPKMRITIPSWSMSFSPGKIGELLSSSPKMQPTDHKSTASV